jgi:Ca2+-binding EF-hand superfamily protein
LKKRLENKFSGLSEAFQAADVDCTGSISVDNFRGILDDFELALAEDDFSRMVTESGSINYRSFKEQFFKEASVSHLVSQRRSSLRIRLTAQSGSKAFKEQVEKESTQDWRKNTRIFQDKRLAEEMLQSGEIAIQEKLADKWHAIRECFLKADVDGNGYMNQAEFKALLRSFDVKLSEEHLNLVMCKYDVDMNNKIRYNEFAGGVGLFKPSWKPPQQQAAAWHAPPTLGFTGRRARRDIFTPPHGKDSSSRENNNKVVSHVSGSELAVTNRQESHQRTVVTPPWALSVREPKGREMMARPPACIGKMTTAR